MSPSEPTETGHLLRAWQAGDPDALDHLIPRVYDELRVLARRSMSGERESHTLQPTALVHEAFARLVGSGVSFNDRAHFLAIASSTMRRILVDHARARRRQKRGGGWKRVPLHEEALRIEGPDVDVLALDQALDRLSQQDERKAKAVELRYFGGLTDPDLATVLGVSEATVQRDLQMARAWLHRELGPAS